MRLELQRHHEFVTVALEQLPPKTAEMNKLWMATKAMMSSMIAVGAIAPKTTTTAVAQRTRPRRKIEQDPRHPQNLRVRSICRTGSTEMVVLCQLAAPETTTSRKDSVIFYKAKGEWVNYCEVGVLVVMSLMRTNGGENPKGMDGDDVGNGGHEHDVDTMGHERQQLVIC